jgi:hypothetical protein
VYLEVYLETPNGTQCGKIAMTKGIPKKGIQKEKIIQCDLLGKT